MLNQEEMDWKGRVAIRFAPLLSLASDRLAWYGFFEFHANARSVPPFAGGFRCITDLKDRKIFHDV
jgi:hypothetical protein